MEKGIPKKTGDEKKVKDNRNRGKENDKGRTEVTRRQKIQIKGTGRDREVRKDDRKGMHDSKR